MNAIALSWHTLDVHAQRNGWLHTRTSTMQGSSGIGDVIYHSWLTGTGRTVTFRWDKKNGFMRTGERG